MHDAAEPARFLVEEWPRIADAVADAPLVDAASGRGRNALHAARSGARTIALDRDAEALASLREAARGLPLLAVRTDLERADATEGPIRAGGCGAVLVFRFLFRPLCAELVRWLRPGGVLVYETFTHHQRELGYGPRNPAFLLADGELPELFPELEVLRHEEGVVDDPRPLALARLVARKR